ncbi:MAG: Uma2 family endonuclease, partial [Oscillospiraceae bacterium]|nr:Uma2 family endonuclease [Oscillospiraceae bacterium]
WDDDIRWELIDGVPYMMSAPNDEHQEILGNLFGLLLNFLKGKPCIVRVAPSDVRLNPESFDDTVVQPDIYIYCDSSKKDKTGIKGAPDMVVEILSPSTAKRDKTIKFEAYRKAGVRELWIIDPKVKTVAVNILSDGKYITHPYGENDTVDVHILDGCEINLSEVFME